MAPFMIVCLFVKGKNKQPKTNGHGNETSCVHGGLYLKFYLNIIVGEKITSCLVA